MRSRLILALALACCAACERSGGNDGGNDGGNEGAAAGAPPVAGVTAPAATLSLAATGAGGCAARWDGRAVSREAILLRGVALIDRAATAAGGVQHLTEETLPFLRVEAPAPLSFACAGPMLANLQRAGFLKLELHVAGSAEQPGIVHFPLMDIDPPPPSVTVAIGADGRLAWNREAVDPGGLSERARAMSFGADVPGPPGELAIVPALGARFGTVVAAGRAIREGGVAPNLVLPSARGAGSAQ
jgi:hypothetical protein